MTAIVTAPNPAATTRAAGSPTPDKVTRARPPEQAFTKPLDHRRGIGRAARTAASRGDHGGWKAPANRGDPIDLILQQEKTRLQNLLPIRHSRMLETPFTF